MANDTFRLIGFIQDDLRNVQSKLVELRSQLAAMDLPMDDGRQACPQCGLRIRGGRLLAEHAYHSHGGPEPEHWKEAASQSPESRTTRRHAPNTAWLGGNQRTSVGGVT